MLILALTALFSIVASAQDYTLSQSENDHYRDYSRAELMQRLGEDSSLLPHYECNSINENKLFWTPLRKNSKRNSLTIQFPNTNKKIFYREGKYFKMNGKQIRRHSNEFVKHVVRALKKIESFPEGSKLLRELEESFFPLTIANGGNAFSPQDANGRNYHGIYQATALSIFHHGRMTSENVPFDNLGAGGRIGWSTRPSNIPLHISLAHEMYHAYDSIRGLIDMRFVVGAKYEHAFISEYRAVYFENLARKAAKIKLRTHYGKDQTGPGMLDEDGKPRMMPSPCL